MEREYLMKSAIAVSLAFAALSSLAWMPASHAQSGPEQVDAARGRIWSLTRDGASLRPAAAAQRAVVALPGWHWAGAPYSVEPALAIGPGGEVIITSDVAPVLWRIDPATLAVSVHALALDADTDKDVGFSALAYSREHDAFVGISGAQGSVWIIDRALARARKVLRSQLN
jgi:hypothetical protein